MAEKTPENGEPVVIKKYANRRLYNTGTSTYVTLEDLAAMVKDGEDFLVYDAKTGDDITRSVLAQIIFEQENKAGQNLLPTTFLRQLIRFYGDSMQMVVPKYLEQSIETLTKEQETQLGIELATKRQEHADLDAAIHTLSQSQLADRMLIQRLKKRKLSLKDRIVQLENILLPDIIA